MTGERAREAPTVRPLMLGFLRVDGTASAEIVLTGRMAGGRTARGTYSA
ncbi:hypothetical protein PWY87_18040 [Kribbella solani]|nr:hypothetical protein [Kribbella solani]MDX3003593.1 hypothetical protein [Kribbella solani]